MGGDTAGVASPTYWRQTDLARRVLRRVEASAQAAARKSDAIKRRLGRAEGRRGAPHRGGHQQTGGSLPPASKNSL